MIFVPFHRVPLRLGVPRRLFLSSSHPCAPPQSSATEPPSPERQTMEEVLAFARPMRIIQCSQLSPKSYKYSICLSLYLAFSKMSRNVHFLLSLGIFPSKSSRCGLGSSFKSSRTGGLNIWCVLIWRRVCSRGCLEDGELMEVSIPQVERDSDGAMECVEGCRRRDRKRATDVRIRNSKQVDSEEVIGQCRTNSLGCRHDGWNAETIERSPGYNLNHDSRLTKVTETEWSFNSVLIERRWCRPGL